MRRFLTRFSEGGQAALAIDPGTLSPALYLSGLPGDGVSAPGGTFASWTDKVLGADFTPSTGTSGITAFNSSVGLNPGVWAVSICGGNFFRGFDAHGGLPGFSAANGYTSYLLIGNLSAEAQGLRGFFWPVLANGLGLIYQGPGFSFFGGVPNGNLAIQDGSSAFDTGIITPTANKFAYDLWALVSDGSANTTLYRNGVLGPVIDTGAVALATNLVFGGPSLGSTFVCALVASYILYTAQHNAGTIAGVHAWYRAKYGAS